jgi:hypothetical protein
VADRTDVSSPEHVPAIAVGEGNRVDLHQEILQPFSIDISVLLIIGPQRNLDERIIPDVARRIEERLPQRIRGVLGGKRSAREEHEHGYRAERSSLLHTSTLPSLSDGIHQVAFLSFGSFNRMDPSSDGG